MPGFRAGPGRLVDATSSPGVASLLEHVLQPLPSTLPPSTAFPGSFMWVPAAGSGAPGTWQVPGWREECVFWVCSPELAILVVPWWCPARLLEASEEDEAGLKVGC